MKKMLIQSVIHSFIQVGQYLCQMGTFNGIVHEHILQISLIRRGLACFSFVFRA